MFNDDEDERFSAIMPFQSLLYYMLLSLHLTIDIAHRLEFIRVMLQKLQCNVFMLSYRGYAYSKTICVFYLMSLVCVLVIFSC